jgi:hypothetical protein
MVMLRRREERNGEKGTPKAKIMMFSLPLSRKLQRPT